MNRRDLFKKLATFPFFAVALAKHENHNVITLPAVIPPKVPYDSINAGCSCLMASIMRMGIDSWGEDCEVVGHPAQKLAWNQMRHLIAEANYPPEFNKTLCDYLMGDHFTADYKMPMDRVEFRRDGKVVGWIACLAIPHPYWNTYPNA